MRFNRLICILVLLSLAGSWTLVAERIIDVHVHFDGKNPAFFEDLKNATNSLDYSACVLTPYADRLASVVAAKKYPRLVIPIGYLQMDDPHAVDEVKEFHRLGYRGLGELEAPHRRYRDPAYLPIYALANQYHWVILFHTGIDERDHFTTPENNGSYRMQASYLEEIARRFPDITIIGAHCGNPDYRWAAEVARWNPNVFFDLSGTTLTKFRGRLSDFLNIFWWSGTHEGERQPENNPSAFTKIVFGSDEGFTDSHDNLPEIPAILRQYRDLFSACGVPPDAQRLILGETMAKILHFPEGN